MFVLANILAGLASVVHTVLQLGTYVLIARIGLSWLQPNPSSGFLRSIIGAIYALTDPVLYQARRLLPFLRVGALDLSPIAVFLALGFADQVLTSSLYQAAAAIA